MSDGEIFEAFKNSGAVLAGHFVLAGEDHSGMYLEKTKAVISSSTLCYYSKKIAWEWVCEGIEAVVGPAIAGIKIATAVSLALYEYTNEDVLSLYTEKDDKGKQILKRGKEDIRGKRILVVEDIVTTGGSVAETIKQCREAGANVVGCHILVDRSGGKVSAEILGVEKLLSLATIEIETYPESECPLCKAKIPINTEVGHGEEYLKKHPEKADW